MAARAKPQHQKPRTTIETNRPAAPRFQDRLAAIGSSAAFGYLTIFLLQWKVIRGIWQWRDMTDGDTSEYFIDAYRWYSTGHGRLVWSPLYTLFYSLFLHISEDAFVVTTLHRLAIIFILAFLVLALMRRLLPPGYAWLAAAWWVVLPIGFNSLYEVHMFGVIPLLLAPLATLWMPGRWGRGCCFAILLLDAALVRNEFLLAAILFGAGCLGWELWTRGNGEGKWAIRYGVPAALVCVLVLIFYFQRYVPPEVARGSLAEDLANKHRGNVCEVYAFGYQQRHSDWQESPWLQCRDLMERQFGLRRPSLMQAFRRNPSAILEHFWWNTSLTPNGLQVLLLNMMSGTMNPDYAAVTRFPLLAVPGSLIILAVLAIGGYFLYRDWSHWWNTLLMRDGWAWFAMLCISCVTPVIILTQRPRPSYLLAFGIFIRAAIGVCTLALLHRVPRPRWAPALGPVIAMLLIAITPSYFLLRHLPRPLHDRYEALLPFRQILAAPGLVFTTSSWPNEIRNFIVPSVRHHDLFFGDLLRQVTPQTPLKQVLERNHVDLFFVDDNMLGDPRIRDFVGYAHSNGWRIVGGNQGPGRHWCLLSRLGI